MEKFSSFERVIGAIPEEEKEQILRKKEELFDSQVFEELRGKEREKMPEEMEIIELANEATNEIRRKYGLEDFNVPHKNIHILLKESWKDNFPAFYHAQLQGIAIKEQSHNLISMKIIFHEMLHIKSYNAIQVTAGESPILRDYRVRLTVRERSGKRGYFSNLNEAVTEELTKKFVLSSLDKEIFFDEAQQTKKIIKKYSNTVDGFGRPMLDDDVCFARIEDKSLRESIRDLFKEGKVSTRVFADYFGYKKERKILNILIDKILEKNSEKFKDKEEVFEVFAKGMMTGNMLPIGRLIDGNFGQGTLRRIGELDQNIKAQEEFVNSL